MTIKQNPPTEVGVIVGRFQSPFLHEAHKELIEDIRSRHPKVIIFLGLSPLLGTTNNPLDFESRKQMILSEYPDVNVLYIKDIVCDKKWSENLDRTIRDILSPSQKATLYGSRDSFLPYYSGKYPTMELVSEKQISATEIRKRIAAKVKNSDDFRAGVIWASQNKFPIVYSAVDIAVFNEDCTKLLLGRKPNQVFYRFIGGFSDVNSSSFEEDARREVMEEANIEITHLQYLGSFRINDWRYRKEVDKINSLFYSAIYCFGQAKAQDDIEEVKWFDYSSLKEEELVPEHREMFRRLKEKY